MFGYVRPRKDELKVWELDAYGAAYCGLCHALGRRYGFLARFFLNYDFAFLTMLLTPVSGRPETRRRRCIVCPLRGREVCAGGAGLDLCADESVILTYWKLLDSVEDASLWQGLSSRVLVRLLGDAYRKAAKARPDFDRTARGCLAELRALEKGASPSLDRTADTFARILQAAVPETGVAARDRAMGQLLYHVGRWIYLTDAWDDLLEDRASGNYNPLITRYPDGPESYRAEVRVTLQHSLNLASSAFGLLDTGGWEGILSNIIYLGLPAVEEAVFSGAWKQLKKQSNGRTRHERSI